MKIGDLARFQIGKVGSCYPGGKGSVYQKLINLIPPHDAYIEAFLGGGSVMRQKRAAGFNVGIDIDPDVISVWNQWSAAASPKVTVPAAAVIPYLGNDRRERERIRRKCRRWTAKLAAMDRLERQALLAALSVSGRTASGEAASTQANSFSSDGKF